MKSKKLKVIAVYDLPSVGDRYTVYYNFVEKIQEGKKFYMCLGMSEQPFHPQGICHHGSGQLGRHNGKRIKLTDLPQDCQKAVEMDLR